MSASEPLEVKLTSRQVIEHKILDALDDGQVVAALFTKRDLEDLIGACYSYAITVSRGSIASTKERRVRCKKMGDDLSQLLREAFPQDS